MEAEPLRFFEEHLEPLWDTARQTLAEFVGAEASQLAFVPNATTGINTVLQSLSFRLGDELLTTNHEYNALRNALNVAAQRSGATVVVADVPFPIESSDRVVESILSRVTQRTRLVLLDHVTSQTGLVLPIEPLVAELNLRDIDVLVDGAHAPGMLPLSLKKMGVAYYTGNCHKWLCSPKGAAFLYIREDRQATVRPLVISHGANSPRCDRSRFHLEFDWTGTADPTAYLCVPEAIQFMGSLLPQGWSELMSHNRNLSLTARQQLCQGLDVGPPCPEEMIGSMAVVPLPDCWVASPIELQTTLFHRFRIEVPVIPWQPCSSQTSNPQKLLRISAQVYNAPAEYDVLTKALKELATGYES
jgi:isopenicillin-N epimerase